MLMFDLFIHIFINLDKIGMPISEQYDPRKTYFHSESKKSGSSNDQIEKMKIYFKSMWDRIDIKIRKQIFKIYEPDLLIYNYHWDYTNNDISFNLPEN